MPLVNIKQMVKKAYANHYAVPHININNLEWAIAALKAAQKERSPIILATSEGAIKYIGGVHVVVGMVKGLVQDMSITVPVALHLDHGGFEMAKKALEAGFTSVMYDGSHEPFGVNLNNTKQVVALAKVKNASVEAEIGTIGGEEDGVIGTGEIAKPDEFVTMAKTGIDILAAGINNVHGVYPKGWKGLRFDVLKQLQNAVPIPMVLHGGSGIPKGQVQKAIALGVAKVNVNTECQQAFAKATRKYIELGYDKHGKGFDPRKLLAPGVSKIIEVVSTKICEFGSCNRA